MSKTPARRPFLRTTSTMPPSTSYSFSISSGPWNSKRCSPTMIPGVRRGLHQVEDVLEDDSRALDGRVVDEHRMDVGRRVDLRADRVAPQPVHPRRDDRRSAREPVSDQIRVVVAGHGGIVNRSFVLCVIVQSGGPDRGRFRRPQLRVHRRAAAVPPDAPRARRLRSSRRTTAARSRRARSSRGTSGRSSARTGSPASASRRSTAARAAGSSSR